MTGFVEFLEDEEDTGITNAIRERLTVRQVRVKMTSEIGYMAARYYRDRGGEMRFAGSTDVCDTKEEAIRQGVEMLQNSEDRFAAFIEQQNIIRTARGMEPIAHDYSDRGV